MLPNYWGTWTMFLILCFFSFLPRRYSLWLGRQIGIKFLRRNKKRASIAKLNLEWCFPDESEKVRQKILYDHVICYGQAIVDIGMIIRAPRRKIEQNYTIFGLDEFKSLLSSGKRVLLVIPHVVGIDMVGAALAKVAPGVSMMKAPKNLLMHWWLWRGRSRFGATILTREQGILQFARAIRAGKVGYIMPDEDLGEENCVYAKFFGIDTATIPVVGRLANITNSEVIPVSCKLDSNGHYNIRLMPPLVDFPTKDVVNDAATVNRAFEECIREDPEQYLWTLKWFQTRPDGRLSPYE